MGKAGRMLLASLQKMKMRGSDKPQKENQEKDIRSDFPRVGHLFLQ